MKEKLTGKQLVLKILDDVNTPLSSAEIFDTALKSGYAKLYARGTDNTQKVAQISSLLSTWTENENCPLIRYEKGYNGNTSIVYTLKKNINQSKEPDKIISETSRPQIGQAQKMRVWTNYWGNCINGLCIVNGAHIKLNDCVIGHIVAYAISHDNSDENLAPICNECNKAMGTMDMREYKKLHHPDIEVACKKDIFKEYITKDDVLKCLEKWSKQNVDTKYFEKAIELIKKY